MTCEQRRSYLLKKILTFQKSPKHWQGLQIPQTPIQSSICGHPKFSWPCIDRSELLWQHQGNLHNIQLLHSSKLVGQRPVEVCLFTCVGPEIDWTRLNCSMTRRFEKIWVQKIHWRRHLIASEFYSSRHRAQGPKLLKDELEANPSGLVKRRGQVVRLDVERNIKKK